METERGKRETEGERKEEREKREKRERCVRVGVLTRGEETAG